MPAEEHREMEAIARNTGERKEDEEDRTNLSSYSPINPHWSNSLEQYDTYEEGGRQSYDEPEFSEDNRFEEKDQNLELVEEEPGVPNYNVVWRTVDRRIGSHIGSKPEVKTYQERGRGLLKTYHLSN